MSNLYAYTGRQSLQMNGPGSSLYQSFPVSRGFIHAVGLCNDADRRSLTGSEAGFFQMIFLDGGGNRIDPRPRRCTSLVRAGPRWPADRKRRQGGGWNAFDTAAVAPANAVTPKQSLSPMIPTESESAVVDLLGRSAVWSSVAGPSKLSAGTISNSGAITVGPTNTITTSSTFTQTSTGTLDIQLGGARHRRFWLRSVNRRRYTRRDAYVRSALWL